MSHRLFVVSNHRLTFRQRSPNLSTLISIYHHPYFLISSSNGWCSNVNYEEERNAVVKTNRGTTVLANATFVVVLVDPGKKRWP
mmetsp:Transcript_43683/g.105920  ORF Transcript_43683/g.105920 Transcript_43683/m.105920 type:complete len:84 (-) Transcript_43683:144-395(-)